MREREREREREFNCIHTYLTGNNRSKCRRSRRRRRNQVFYLSLVIGVPLGKKGCRHYLPASYFIPPPHTLPSIPISSIHTHISTSIEKDLSEIFINPPHTSHYIVIFDIFHHPLLPHPIPTFIYRLALPSLVRSKSAPSRISLSLPPTDRKSVV